MSEISHIILKGLHSDKEIEISIDIVRTLVDAYMRLIPNEKRDLGMALMVLRFHDDLREMVSAEYHATNDKIEKDVLEKISNQLKEETDALPE